MAKPRNMVRPHARQETNDRNHGTGKVVLYGTPEWLSTGLLITCSLTPDEATALAIELLNAAKYAREKLSS